MIEIIVLKVTLLLLLAWTLTLALRNRSAATRHFVWCAALFGCAALLATANVHPVRVPVWTAATPVAALPRSAVTEVRAATRVAAVQTAGEPQTPFPVLPSIYLAGLLAVILWSAAGHIALARIARRAVPADGFHLSNDIGAPVTWGTLILLPSEAATWPAERRDAALLHERAHVERRDFLVQSAARLVCAVFWFHPLVWVALRRLRAESEQACDDRVLAAGMVPADYASQLLAVAQGALARPHGAAAALAMARPSELESRLVAVLDEHRSHGPMSRRIAAIAALLVGIVILPVAFAETQKRATDSHDIPASSGETLTLDLITGASVDIRGWNEQRVSVETTMGEHDGSDPVVNINRAPNGVRITSEYRTERDINSSSIHLTIRAPYKYNVQLDSSGGGLTLVDLTGTFRGTTGGGEIVLDRVRGEARLSTGGGKVRVTNSDLRGDVSTGGGEVRIAHVTGGLNASSGSGPVIHDDDEDDQNGMSISKPGGAITIGEKHGDVEASTGGGDITIGPVAGSVRASTGAGDVEVTIVDANGRAQSVDISSGKGRIEVELPWNYDGRFDIQTAFTEDNRPTSIESDWEIARLPVTGWDDREGTARRYVRARAVVGQGHGLVRIRTVNGNVVLRRSAK